MISRNQTIRQLQAARLAAQSESVIDFLFHLQRARATGLLKQQPRVSLKKAQEPTHTHTKGDVREKEGCKKSV